MKLLFRQRFFSWFDSYDVFDEEGRTVYTVQGTFFRPSFKMDVRGWHIAGDILEWDYYIEDAMGRRVAGLSKQLFKLTDTYVLEIGNPEDALYVLMAALAIDAAKCSSDK